MNKDPLLEQWKKAKTSKAKYHATEKLMVRFVPCIPWEQIEMILGKKDYKKFVKWMSGQTAAIGGVYEWDLKKFLKGLPCID